MSSIPQNYSDEKAFVDCVQLLRNNRPLLLLILIQGCRNICAMLSIQKLLWYKALFG